MLIAHFHEHRAAVNSIQVSADNHFFVSGSDDGTVKVWDCQRLEKNVTNRSRLTFSAAGKVKALAMCENSHSVAIGTESGSISVARVEYALPGFSSLLLTSSFFFCRYIAKKEGLTRYTGCTPIKHNLERSDGPVVAISHFNTLTQSLLAYATTKGKLHGWDLRAKAEAWLLTNPLSQGVIQDFVVDPQRNWLTAATSRGYLTCWDLRFHIPIKAWRHPGRSRIHRLAHYNVAGKGTWIFVSAGLSEVDVWDVESGHVRTSPCRFCHSCSCSCSGNFLSSILFSF